METQMEITMDDIALMEPGIQILVEKLENEPHLFDAGGDMRWLKMLLRVLNDDTIFEEHERKAVYDAARITARKIFTGEVVQLTASAPTAVDAVGKDSLGENLFKNINNKDRKPKSTLAAMFERNEMLAAQTEGAMLERQYAQQYKNELAEIQRQRQMMQQHITTGIGGLVQSNITTAVNPDAYKSRLKK